MKIIDAINQYRDYIKANKTAGTLNFYSFYFKRLEAYFSSIDVEEISKTSITSFIAFIRDQSPKIKNASINKYLVTLKAILKYTIDKKIDYKKLTEQKPIIPIISDYTINRVFEHLKKHFNDRNQFRNYVLFKVLFDTGLRVNEVLHLKIYDIDLASNTIHVKITKTSSDRYVCFTDSTKDLLSRYLISFEAKPLLFYDLTTGQALRTSSVESIVYRLKKRLKLQESISPHKWRHTFSTNFLNRGGNLETLRLILGHTSLKTTQKYLHLSKKNIQDEYAKVMRNTDNP